MQKVNSSKNLGVVFNNNKHIENHKLHQSIKKFNEERNIKKGAISFKERKQIHDTTNDMMWPSQDQKLLNW